MSEGESIYHDPSVRITAEAGVPRMSEPRQVDVPSYPSGTIRYRHDGHGWGVLESDGDGFRFRGSLVSHGWDSTWVIARFAEALAQLTEQGETIRALREALTECADDLEVEVGQRYGYPDVHPAMQRKYDRDMEPVTRARALSSPTP